jgi:RNA polymerase sigma factor (TIGR02999 family)
MRAAPAKALVAAPGVLLGWWEMEIPPTPPAPPSPEAGEITRMLGALGRGEVGVQEEFLKAVYLDLRRLAASKMAHQPSGHTLQATALVHEAWMRLVDADGQARFENRAHFFAAAAEAMRRILVDHARKKYCEKRGGRGERCDVDELEIAAPTGNQEELLAVHETLDQLATHDARKAELVKLRYFVGLSIEEAAEVLGISASTANREWAYARAWLHSKITRGALPASG